MHRAAGSIKLSAVEHVRDVSFFEPFAKLRNSRHRWARDPGWRPTEPHLPRQLAHWLVTAPSIPAHPRLVPRGRARETSTPTRSSSLALPKPFEPAPGNAGVRGGMLGVSMTEVILHGAQIGTLVGQIVRTSAPLCGGAAVCELLPALVQADWEEPRRGLGEDALQYSGDAGL